MHMFKHIMCALDSVAMDRTQSCDTLRCVESLNIRPWIEPPTSLTRAQCTQWSPAPIRFRRTLFAPADDWKSLTLRTNTVLSPVFPGTFPRFSCFWRM